MADENKNNRGTLILLLLLLVGSVGFNVYQWRNQTSTVTMYSTEVDSLTNVRIEVERELASTSMELQKYRGIAVNLDSLLNDANDKIASEEKRIHELVAKEKDFKKLNKQLKKELADLQKMRDEYLERIDGLMAENTELKQKNTELTSTIGNLTEQKTALEQKVTTASTLKAEYVKVNSFKKKHSGKLVESVLAKKTNKISTCLTIMDNKVAPAGDKMVYLRILAPNGKPLQGYSKATFTNANGESVDATSSQKISYSGDKQDLCLAYENDDRILESGTYNIEVYIENTLVYQSTYVLR